MSTHLKKSLSPILLWGLGVGYVISGMYFGWNIGLDKGGTLGLGIATVFILIMYITFSLSYSELACAIPKAGGVFDYVGRAFGKDLGFLAGMAQWIEFVFAPPAIALGIGAYFHILYPAVDELVFAIVAYFIFTAINIIGVKISATFELIITIIAVAELSLFASLTLPHFQLQNLQTNPFPHGIEGIFAAIPFAIWFFLGMEGIANVAEETIDPQKNITKAFMYSMATLGLLAAMTFCAAVGVGGWEKVVYDSAGKVSDSPLPMALGQITGNSGLMYHMLVSVGLFGFVASFNGLFKGSRIYFNCINHAFCLLRHHQWQETGSCANIQYPCISDSLLNDCICHPGTKQATVSRHFHGGLVLVNSKLFELEKGVGHWFV